MRLRKIVIGTALALGIMGVSVSANAKTKVATIKVTKKSQVSSASRKAWSNYKKNKPYKVTGRYSTNVKKYVKKQIMLSNGIRWCNTPVTSSKAAIVKYKKGYKYLGLIIKDLNDIYNKVISRYDTATDFIIKRTDDYWVYNEETNSKRRIIRMKKEEVKAYEGVSYSEIKAVVMSQYFGETMHWDEKKYDTGITQYEKVYKSTYKGSCHWSALTVMDIAKAWGLQPRYFANYEEDHAWACIKAKNIKGNKYWRGVDGSSWSRAMSLDGKSVCNLESHAPQSMVLDPETRDYVEQLTASHK